MAETPAIIILSASGLKTAEILAARTGGEIHGYAKRLPDLDTTFEDPGDHLRNLFVAGRTIIAIMASGALIRLLAPAITDKRAEPPVVAVADDGSAVVPLLGGHRGANQIARVLAEELGTESAITTAGDLAFGIALDEPPAGWVLSNPEHAKDVMARLLAGDGVYVGGELASEQDWIAGSRITIEEDSPARLIFSNRSAAPQPLQLVYRRRSLVLGLGCERHLDPQEMFELVDSTLDDANIAVEAIACIASIDLKADEKALTETARRLGVPARFFPASVLERETPRLENPSKVVFAEVGCHGVSEGAALAAAGESGILIVSKRKSRGATVAIADAGKVIDLERVGRSRGQLSVVGIGPGSDAWRSPEVSHLVSRASDLVGYSLYLDLLGPLAKGKARHDFDLGREEDRVRHAMELAGEGKNVALVCSGDAGIYAMATLVFELLDAGDLSDAARRIAIEVSPGISALQAAAARAGAPLGHDFCTISLSDLLTPWDAIKLRVECAAKGDFVIAFYNPVSRRRRTQLAHARDTLLKHRPADTPVILATNLGREGERLRIVPLGELDIDDVDMLTVVIVGSSATRTVETGDSRTWVFTPRGYAAKAGSSMENVG